MIYNLVSVKKVISKVFTDLDLEEGNHRIADMIEWCGEGLKKIGAFPQMVTKVAGKEGIPSIQIQDYQAKLPEDLYTINQVAYSHHSRGPFYPVRYATGSFSLNHELTTKEGYWDTDRITGANNGVYIDGSQSENLGTGYPQLTDKNGYRSV